VDQILADEQVATGSPSDVRWPMTDWQGTVRDVATYNAATNVTTIANHKVYEAFGKVYSESGPTVDTLFGYTGRYFDDDAGLQWNLNRWYDPNVGRWLSEDPIGFAGGDPNLYRYVGNSPGDSVDPSGLAGDECTGLTMQADTRGWWQRTKDWYYDVWNYDFVDPATGVGTRPLEGVFTSTVRSAIHQNVKPIGGGVMDAGKFLVVDAPMFVYDNSFSAIAVHGLDRTIEANKRRLEALKGTAELMANWDQVPDYTAGRIAQRLGAGAATSYGTGVGLGKGLTALRAARLKLPTACESTAPAKAGTFVDQMTPAEAARYRDYWGGYSVYQRDTSGMAPFGTKTAFTEAGDVKTVTTFDQYGRPYLQYGVNEGEPFHQHGFEYPTNRRPGTGWAPIRKPGDPVR
jgi:RHS repeat-associated protein